MSIIYIREAYLGNNTWSLNFIIKLADLRRRHCGGPAFGRSPVYNLSIFRETK